MSELRGSRQLWIIISLAVILAACVGVLAFLTLGGDSVPVVSSGDMSQSVPAATPKPSAEPTPEPTAEPTPEPTPTPTATPKPAATPAPIYTPKPTTTPSYNTGSNAVTAQTLTISKTQDHTASGIYNTATISAEDVTLKNKTINGDLVISSAVGNGDVTLENVIVKGRIIMNGGGLLHLTDVTANEIVTQKKSGTNALVVSGKTTVNTLTMKNHLTLDEDDMTAGFDGVRKVVIGVGTPVYQKFSLLGGEVDSVLVGDTTNIFVKKGATIGTLTAAARTHIENEGTVDKLVVNHDDVTYDGKLSDIDVKKGYSEPVSDSYAIGETRASTGGSSATPKPTAKPTTKPTTTPTATPTPTTSPLPTESPTPTPTPTKLDKPSNLTITAEGENYIFKFNGNNSTGVKDYTVKVTVSHGGKAFEKTYTVVHANTEVQVLNAPKTDMTTLIGGEFVAGDTISFTVIANNSSSSYSPSAASNEVIQTFTKFQQAEAITFNPSKIDNKISLSVSYSPAGSVTSDDITIMVGSANHSDKTFEADSANPTSMKLKNPILVDQAKTITVTISGAGDEAFVLPSEDKTASYIVKKLTTPTITGISRNEADKAVITFVGDENAASYSLLFSENGSNVGSLTTAVSPVESSVVLKENVALTVSIVALPAADSMTLSSDSSSYSVTPLAVPTDFSVTKTQKIDGAGTISYTYVFDMKPDVNGGGIIASYATKDAPGNWFTDKIVITSPSTNLRRVTIEGVPELSAVRFATAGKDGFLESRTVTVSPEPAQVAKGDWTIKKDGENYIATFMAGPKQLDLNNKNKLMYLTTEEGAQFESIELIGGEPTDIPTPNTTVTTTEAGKMYTVTFQLASDVEIKQLGVSTPMLVESNLIYPAGIIKSGAVTMTRT